MKKKSLKFMFLTVILFISTTYVNSTTNADTFVSSRIYTSDTDFDEGILTGLEHDTVHDQLQLKEQQTIFPFIWVPNGEGTVSKVHTETGDELARYRVAPFFSKPSRTAVDRQGNCWVGNLIGGTVVKIGLYEADQWIDRNGDGICQTSQDANNDGSITGDEILVWGEDECVLFVVALLNGREGTYTPGDINIPYDMNELGTSPRGLAIDVNNNLWVGTYRSIKYYYIEGGTGTIQQKVDIPISGFYIQGAMIDKNGILWSSGDNKPNILRLDPSTDPPGITVVNCPAPAYGLSLDNLNHLYLSYWNYAYLSRINISKNTLERNQYKSELTNSRGITCTNDNDVWITNVYTNYVFRYTTDGTRKATIYVGNRPTGLSVDAAGKVWVVGEIPNSPIMRINPEYNSVDLQKVILGHQGHHGYNEMTGNLTQTVTTDVGSWTVDFDSGSDDTPWGTISWTSYEPGETSVTVKVRSSNNKISWSPWEVASNDDLLSTTPNGRYLQIKAILELNSGETSPILYDLTVETKNRSPQADAGGPYITTEGSILTIDASGSSDPDGDVLSYAWDLDGDGQFDDSDQSSIITSWIDNYYGTVAVEVFDGEFTDIATTTVTIENVAPVVVIDSLQQPNPDKIVVGDIIAIFGSFTDPGIEDTHTVEWDFGDGTIITGTLTPTHAYSQAGDYTIILVVIDDDGGVGSDSMTITVEDINHLPQADVGGPYLAFEGSSVTFDASGSLDPDGDILSYTWDLNDDGVFDDGTLPVTTATWNDDYFGNVAVRVSDGEYTDEAATTVTILNVAPITSIDDLIPEFPDRISIGDSLELIGSYFDPGIKDTHTIEWDFGDGTIVIGTLSAIHSYTEAGIYTITLNVTDDDEGVGLDSLTITVEVRNYPPLADAGGPYLAAEGSPVTLDASISSDPDGDELLYRWDLDNDGIWDTEYTLDPTFTNIWFDDYSGIISVEVFDGEYSDIATAIVTIVNVAPVVTIEDLVQPYPDFILVEDNLEIFGSFFDPGLIDIHEIEWDFGDGTIVIGTLSAIHSYTEPGVYTINFKVTDDEDGVGADSLTIIVWSPRDLKQSVISILENAKTGYNPVDNQLDRIIFKIERSLKDKFWIDEMHLHQQYGILVFSFEHCAVAKMEGLTKYYSCIIPKIEEKILWMKEKGLDTTFFEKKLNAMNKALTAFESIMYRLVKADALLAERLYTEVKNIQVECPKRQKIVERLLMKAERFLINAQEHLENDQYKRAIRDYAAAWCFTRIAQYFVNRC